MPLKPGQDAPPFAAEDQTGATIRSSDLEGQRYVLFFYPHDDTPICTRQACGFESQRETFEGLGVPIFGVSANSARSHKRFAEKHGLNFPLLVDRDRRIIKDYDVDGLFGRITRVSYIIGPDGKVEGTHRAELSGKGHSEWAREQVQRLEQAIPK